METTMAIKKPAVSPKPPKITQFPPLFPLKPLQTERVTRRPGSADFEKLPSRAGEQTIPYKPSL
jgi:hypothetical protein